MKILDYYLQKQNDKEWYRNYQSVSGKCQGKTFSFVDTNFRKVLSFCSQLESFKPKDGIKRADWTVTDKGQEEDKHRVVKLLNAGFICNTGDVYHITEKGHEVLRINDDDNLTEEEKWILVFMLIVDYKNNNIEMDIIKTALTVVEKFTLYGIDRKKLMLILNNNRNVKDKSELFRSDIFWLLSFHTDSDFMNIFINSSLEEKKELYDYVIAQSSNLKSKDCIAHKFISSGAYQVNTFKNDMDIILCIMIISAIKDKSWGGFLELASKIFKNVNKDNLLKFISYNEQIYEDVYNNSFGKIFNMIGE